MITIKMVSTKQGKCFSSQRAHKCFRLKNAVISKKSDGTQQSKESSENDHQGEQHKLSSKRGIISFLFSMWSDITLDFHLCRRVPIHQK